jgi:methylated-DNA-[protein]-cysteine S-methyltransferase
MPEHACNTYYSIVPSPVGELRLEGDGACLSGLFLAGQRYEPPLTPDQQRDDTRFAAMAEQLAAYFAGRLTSFELPLAPRGTPFQQQVWQALTRIPYGQTTTDGTIPHQLGRPAASRAVGAAVGQNPISIVIPCHRVVGSQGSLTGYAGGLDRKRWLLEHERQHATEGRTPVTETLRLF